VARGHDYDLIAVGGGLAGSALAKVMAEAGASVLIVERERAFRDRVRGEGMHPWGVSEVRELGLYDALLKTCGQEVRYWARSRGGEAAPTRDLIATTPHHAGEMTFYHPAMQNEVLRLAEAAGAEVWRGAAVVAIRPGSAPAVTVRTEGEERELSARLIVGADGRQSHTRGWSGFQVLRNPERLRITGVLLTDTDADPETISTFSPLTFGQMALLFPLTGGRLRAYFTTARRTEHPWLSGEADLPLFLSYCIESGAPAGWFSRARLAGPLATFEGADSWVDHPYREGVVLIGDAAGASDPSWGCGLSLTVKDVRTLRDKLCATADWDGAANEYAAERAEYFQTMRTLEQWMTEILYGLGPEADQIRAHAMPQLAGGRGPDITGLGPAFPTDDTTRIRFLGR
jgi:2-polyprenyl-6-methoxyphenol hydroxylase-like FAD-dependent oxidoreductase